MKLSDFDFHLPDGLIALRPARPRDHARLMEVKADEITDRRVCDLADLLKPGDRLVFNNTRVIHAALSGYRPARAVGGGADVAIDINLHKRVDDRRWLAFARPAKRLKQGDLIQFADQLSAEIELKSDGGEITLCFNLAGSQLDDAITALGAPPLPPYISSKRAPDIADIEDYQTIYAEPDQSGSVAAPTAGLHFTDTVFDQLKTRGVDISWVTLHVGAGTFLPVKTETLSEHIMHSERYQISAETAHDINNTRMAGGRIIAVGTTSLRTLESAANGQGGINAQTGDTDIFITPGYDFQIVDGLMTNFHLPKSTLFMLVCALAGYETMHAAYAHAIENQYRFFSYGDSSLLWR